MQDPHDDIGVVIIIIICQPFHSLSIITTLKSILLDKSEIDLIIVIILRHLHFQNI
jgi:hypothetical protein